MLALKLVCALSNDETKPIKKPANRGLFYWLLPYFLGATGLAAAAGTAGAVPDKVISGFSLAKVLSPMPGTLFKSSTVLKLPFFLR